MSSADQDRKTCPPTSKRIGEFRKRGDIALSRDLSAIAAMGGAWLVGLLCAQQIGHSMSQYMQRALGQLGAPSSDALGAAATAFLVCSLPIALGAIIGWTVSMLAQLGWPPAFRPFKMDLPNVFNPMALVGLLSPKGITTKMLRSLAKLLAVGLLATWVVAREFVRFRHEPVTSAAMVGERLLQISGRLMLYAGTTLIGLALLDYWLARRGKFKQMKMTPEEVKNEFKDTEGDPKVRGKRRQRMRELAKRRLAIAVKSADVVLVNPTEYAVALRYVAKKDRAPKVVAKGRGAVAERIRELARQAGVPIVPEPPLTRLIFKLVPEGREIPVTLYRAVAEVLAHVYRIRRRVAR